jgi:signal transduction histidine kinase
MSADEHAPRLNFADGPKLELDELIDQLVVRAQGVKLVQGRLRTLLRAIEAITSDLGLEVVLRQIVESACELAGARYGALGVIAADGSLEQFIHVGMPDDVVAEIGHLPEGKGLLGALINDPHPIRHQHIADDPRSSGFPRNHPPMASFLGVPIRVRGEVFGNLYLTESQTGQFTAEDEELVRSLAITAGTAITNARLYHESRLQQRWLTASAEIGSQLLSESGEDPLRTIARRAAEITEADVVTVGLVGPGRDGILIEVAVGDTANRLLARTFPLAGTLAGKAIDGRAPLLLRSAGDAEGRESHTGEIMDVGPTMVLPLIGTSDVLGVLTIARNSSKTAFTSIDLSMAAAFANNASLALELAIARTDQQRMATLEDRDRIARDLHDHVIQQLFAIGLSLESIALSPHQPEAEKLHDRVGDIDRTIRQIRTSIFELRGPLASPSAGVRADLLAIVAESAPALGFAARMSFSGPVDPALGTEANRELVDDVAACVREALANVARHARARRVDVEVDVRSGEVTVTVTDDGIGIGEQARSSGLRNLRIRAERHGGSFTVRPAIGAGTQLLWKAPIS